MSHTMGVVCAECKAVLIDDSCPERDCAGNHGSTYQDPTKWAAKTWPDHPCFFQPEPAPTKGRVEIPDVEPEAFHAAADRANDSHDHDELHAAGAIWGSDCVYASLDPYISRWLAGLIKLHEVKTVETTTVVVSGAQKSAAKAMVERSAATGREVPESVHKIANAKKSP